MFKKIMISEKKSTDDRGIVYGFDYEQINNLHIATMNPGAIRGNHSHKMVEYICVINGDQICEIELKNIAAKQQRKISVKNDLEIFRIDAHIIHTVKNTGNTVFYLVCFNEG